MANTRSLLRTLQDHIGDEREARIRRALPVWRREANRRNPPGQQAADPVSFDTLRRLVREAEKEHLSGGERQALDIFIAAFATMSRVGEIVALETGDVAPEGDMIAIRPKTGAKTWLRLRKRVVDTGGLQAAERLARRRSEALQEGRKALFVGRSGERQTTAAITAKLKRVSRRLGAGTRLTAHSARKGAAVEALLAGVPLPVIQALGGWRDLNTLQAYIGEAVRRTTSLMTLLGDKSTLGHQLQGQGNKGWITRKWSWTDREG